MQRLKQQVRPATLPVRPESANGSANARRRGAVLIVALGILTILALMAAAFTNLAAVERETSAQHLYLVRARLAAVSGLEVGITRLEGYMSGRPWTQAADDRWIYHGEDADADGEMDGVGGWDEQGEDMNGNGKLDQGVPLRLAARPSFALDSDGDGTCDRVWSDRWFVGVSGWMEGADSDREFYSLQVMDCSSQVYVNTGAYHAVSPADVADPDNASIRLLLNNLAEALHVLEYDTDLPADWQFDPATTAGQIGDQIIEGRANTPDGIYLTKSQLAQALEITSETDASLRSQSGQDRLDVLESFLTVHAWTDPWVLRPAPRTDTSKAEVGDDADTMPEWPGDGSRDDGNLVLLPRAPININAAPKPVLMACMMGLQGKYVVPRDRGSNNLELWCFETEPIEAQLTAGNAGAEEIADEIIARRLTEPFTTWSDFYKFVDELPNDLFPWPSGYFTDSWTSSIQQEFRINYMDAVRSCVKANANPNTMANGFNADASVYHADRNGNGVGPDDSGAVAANGSNDDETDDFELKTVASFREVDKINLTASTTEFCFGPTGWFEVISLGRVVRNGELLSQARVRAVIEMGGIVRHTNQKQFDDNRLTDTEGDYVVTFPESKDDLLSSGGWEMAEWDGRIQLRGQDTYIGDDTLLNLSADFDGTLDPKDHRTDSSGTVISRTGTKQHQEDSSVIQWGGDTVLSDLYPDGMLSKISRDRFYELENDTSSSPVFGVVDPADDTLKNTDVDDDSDMLVRGSTGAVEMWVKYRQNPESRWGSGLFRHLSVISEGEVTSTVADWATETQTVYTGLESYFWKKEDLGRQILDFRRFYYVTTSAQWISPTFWSDYYKDSINYTLYDSKADISVWNGGEWHHVAIMWWDWTESRIYLDGVESTLSPNYEQGTLIRTGTNGPEDLLSFGNFIRAQTGTTTTFGPPRSDGNVVRFASGTIDTVRAYRQQDSANNGTHALPPDGWFIERFENRATAPEGVWAGTMTVDDGDDAEDITLGTASWTIFIPERAYDPNTQSRVAINEDGATANIVDANIAFRPGATWRWASVANSSDPGVDASVAHNDGRGVSFPDIAPDSELSGFTAGSPVTVDYRIEFTYVDDAGNVLPLNVTPFLEDITISYETPLKVHLWQEGW